MTTDWAKFTDLLSNIVDNRGKTCPVESSGLPLIATNCINGTDLYPNYDTTRFVSEETYKTWFRGHPEPGDILFVCKGSPGRTNWVPDPVDFCIAQDMVSVRANPKKIYPKYLFAALRSSLVQSQIENMHVGTMIPHFKKGDFDKLQIPIFNTNTQVAIGDMYFEISERIANLQNTTVTLEAIAQALFKSWFVDFDPVKRKSEGENPEGISKEVGDFFPSDFVESEIGKIPRGWSIKTIGDIADVIDCLHSKKPQLISSPYPFLQLSNIRDDGLLDVSQIAGISEADYKKWTSRIEVSEGDCVITNVGRVGAISRIPKGFKGAMGRNMTAIRLKQEHSFPTFLIELLQSPWMRTEIESKTDSGTILDALNVKSIPKLRFVQADRKIIDSYETTAKPLREAMEHNLKQIHTLRSIRDSLLPSLISGQLSVNDAEIQSITA